jgi:hypothetical protein
VNLDPLGPPANEADRAPSDWTLDVQRDGVMCRGVVKRRHTELCRIAVASEGLDERMARTALAIKARAWIADYLSRPQPRQEAMRDQA